MARKNLSYTNRKADRAVSRNYSKNVRNDRVYRKKSSVWSIRGVWGFLMALLSRGVRGASAAATDLTPKVLRGREKWYTVHIPKGMRKGKSYEEIQALRKKLYKEGVRYV